MKSGYFKIIISDDQLSGWTKKKLQWTSQSRTCTKKRSWSLFGCLLLAWSTTAFWIPAKPLPLRSMLSKLMKCTKNCNASIQHWSTERTQFFPTTTPNQCPITNASKVEWIALPSFALSAIYLTSFQSTTTSSRISATFCRENASVTSRRPKMLYRSSWNPKAWIFKLQE